MTDKINCINHDFTNWKGRIIGVAAGVSFVIGIAVSIILKLL
jgi:hypothetical protein